MLQFINYLVDTYCHLVWQANYPLLFPIDTLTFYGVSIGTLLAIAVTTYLIILGYAKLKENRWNKLAHSLIPLIIITTLASASLVFSLFLTPWFTLIYLWLNELREIKTAWDRNANKLWQMISTSCLILMTIYPQFFIDDYGFMVTGGISGSVLALAIVIVVFAYIFIDHSDVNRQQQAQDNGRKLWEQIKCHTNAWKQIFTQNKPSDGCCICRDTFKDDDKVITLPCEKPHIFHADCIGRWIKQGEKSCPLCRAEIAPPQHQHA
jgi:hypothetical protein